MMMRAHSDARTGRHGSRLAALAAALLLLPLGACASGGGADASASAAPQVPDLSGAWTLTVQSPNGTGTREVTINQEGNALTGYISSSMATGEIRGSVEGDQVFFVAVVAMDSGDFEITYQATLRDGMLVDGVVDFGDYGAGTFTGKRKGTSADR